MRKVKFFRAHSSLNIHGFGELGTTLPTSIKKLKDLDMRELPSGALQASATCETRGHAMCGKTITFVVGAASVMLYVLDDSEQPQEAKPEAKKAK